MLGKFWNNTVGQKSGIYFFTTKHNVTKICKIFNGTVVDISVFVLCFERDREPSRRRSRENIYGSHVE